MTRLVRLACVGGATDDPCEDRRLQSLAREPAEDRIRRRGPPRLAQLPQLLGELWSERLTAWLGALALADKQRGALALQVHVAPVERDQLGAAQARLDEREQDEAVALDQSGMSPSRVLGGGEQPGELVLGQPVRFLLRFRRRLEVEERVGQAAAATEPVEEAA